MINYLLRLFNTYRNTLTTFETPPGKKSIYLIYPWKSHRRIKDWVVYYFLSSLYKRFQRDGSVKSRYNSRLSFIFPRLIILLSAMKEEKFVYSRLPANKFTELNSPRLQGSFGAEERRRIPCATPLRCVFVSRAAAEESLQCLSVVCLFIRHSVASFHGKHAPIFRVSSCLGNCIVSSLFSGE